MVDTVTAIPMDRNVLPSIVLCVATGSHHLFLARRSAHLSEFGPQRVGAAAHCNGLGNCHANYATV